MSISNAQNMGINDYKDMSGGIMWTNWDSILAQVVKVLNLPLWQLIKNVGCYKLKPPSLMMLIQISNIIKAPLFT